MSQICEGNPLECIDVTMQQIEKQREDASAHDLHQSQEEFEKILCSRCNDESCIALRRLVLKYGLPEMDDSSQVVDLI